MIAAGVVRVALVGPPEEAFADDSDLEYRETMLRSYEEICGGIVAFGTDYTASREFLGIEYMAAVLRREGHEVRVIGATNEGLGDDELVADLVAFAPAVVGMSVLYDLQLARALILSRLLKAALPGIVVVFGGPLASAIAERLLEAFPFVDGVVKGEGEHALASLVAAVRDGRDTRSVPALAFRVESGIVSNAPGRPVALDTLPHPARDAIASIRNRNLPMPSAYITTSRGCRAFCTFCTVPGIVRGMGEDVYRARDPVDVVDEMEALVRDYGITRFYMADDNFLGYGEESNHRMLAFAEELIRRDLQIGFHAECRVDSIIPETLVRLRAAGFDQILFGLESGSPRTLKRWAKGQTVAQNEAAVALARSLGIDLMPSIILLDWESALTEVEETVAFIERNRLHDSSQPLWLVNKLKVHCGTAASRRYDNVHGRPVLPVVAAADDGSIRRWCAALTYQGIAIDDPHVAAFWTALNAAATQWSVLLDEVVPALLKAVRQGVRHGAQPDLGLVRQLALYRRSIGPALVQLMRQLIDAALRAQQSGKRVPDWTQAAGSFVDTHERRHFPDGLVASMGGGSRSRSAGTRRMLADLY